MANREIAWTLTWVIQLSVHILHSIRHPPQLTCFMLGVNIYLTKSLEKQMNYSIFIS